MYIVHCTYSHSVFVILFILTSYLKLNIILFVLGTPKAKRPFEKLAESKLDIADLQKLILEEELQNKRKQWIFEEKEREQKQKRWDFEEEERDHKRQMWALEKKYFLEKKDEK